MSGLGGLNKSPEGVVIGLVQLLLPVVTTPLQLAGQAQRVQAMQLSDFSTALSRRLGIARAWQLFLEQHPVVLLPVSAELPFENDLDLQGPAAYERVWEAQLTMIALPLTGLPALTVSTSLVGRTPVGVQIVAGRFREDLCLAAGAAIEARGVPLAPVDPHPAPSLG